MKPLRTLLSTLLLTLLVTSCQQPAPEVVEAEPAVLEISPNMERDIATVRAYLDALLAADTVAMRNALTEDFLGYFVTSPFDTTTVDENIKNWVENNNTRSNQQNTIVASSSLRVNEGDFVGDWVQIWGRYTAVENSVDIEIVVPYFVNIKMQNGKIDRSFTYYDRLAVYQQLGYELKAPE